MRIVIAGGGTGGHIIPALAVARVLREKHGAEILFIGTSRGLEKKLVPQAGFRLELVEIGALNQVSVITKLKTILNLPRAVMHASRLLRGFHADAVLGVGGYASGPAMLAAILRGCPAMVFEPNINPGMANRLIAGWIKAAAVHFEETKKSFPNATVTGVPVRAEFFAISEKREGKKTLLITGGSQGAHAINVAMVAAAAALKKEVPELLIVHQTGERDFDDTCLAYANAGVEAVVSPFVEDMPAAFAGADLILCRSGASTCAELAAAGRVAVFVPFPHAADDHQTRNATVFVDQGAAVLLPQNELSAEKLVALIAPLLRDDIRRKNMADAARKLAHSQAAEEIAGMIVGIAKS